MSREVSAGVKDSEKVHMSRSQRLEMTYYCELVCFAMIFCRYNFNMDSRVSIPLLTPFTRYSECKLKMRSLITEIRMYSPAAPEVYDISSSHIFDLE